MTSTTIRFDPPPPLTPDTRPWDSVILGTVAVLMVALYVLPEGTSRTLVFRYTEPTAATAFTAHFVHFDFVHLVGKVFGNALLVSLCHLLAVFGGRRRLLVTAYSIILLSFPFTLSVLNLVVPHEAVFYGFSGLNMTFLALLAILLGEYVWAVFWSDCDHRYAGAAFFASLGFVAILAVPVGTSSLAIAGASFGIAGVYSWGVIDQQAHLVRFPRVISDRKGYGNLLIVACVTVPAFSSSDSRRTFSTGARW